ATATPHGPSATWLSYRARYANYHTASRAPAVLRRGLEQLVSFPGDGMVPYQREPARPAVGLVCREPRLRRILCLELEAGGYRVLDGGDPAPAPALDEAIAAVV